MHLHPEALFLIQSIILIGLPYLLWRIKIIKNFIPVVVVQILVGILLGPSVLGNLYPEIYEFLFSKASLATINGLSWIAIVLFGFLTGLHFDINELKGKGKPFVVIGLSSILLPLILSLGAGWLLMNMFPSLIGENATNITFVLAIGIAASVTALPVLGAILVEMGLVTTKLGKTVLGFATINDGLLWILVSILLTLSSGSHGGYGDVIKTIGLTALYMVTIIFVVKPFVERLVKKNVWNIDANNVQLVGVVVMLLISALATELIGIHYLLGSFIFGALIPKDIAHALYHKKEPLVLVVLLPFFFMSTGLKTYFEVSDPQVWYLFLIVAAVSSFGKFVGTALPARYFKYDLKTSVLFGVFMQCKGLMEVVVLNMMLQAKIISPVAFSGMILMAVATTAATKPMALLAKKVFAKSEDKN
jgi:Kef-type K+ transport system membrane component KefB